MSVRQALRRGRHFLGKTKLESLYFGADATRNTNETWLDLIGTEWKAERGSGYLTGAHEIFSFLRLSADYCDWITGRIAVGSCHEGPIVERRTRASASGPPPHLANGDAAESIYFAFALKQTRIAREQAEYCLPDKVTCAASVSALTGQRLLISGQVCDGNESARSYIGGIFNN